MNAYTVALRLADAIPFEWLGTEITECSDCTPDGRFEIEFDNGQRFSITVEEVKV